MYPSYLNLNLYFDLIDKHKNHVNNVNFFPSFINVNCNLNICYQNVRRLGS